MTQAKADPKSLPSGPRSLFLSSLFFRAWQVRLAAIIVLIACFASVVSSIVADSFLLSPKQNADLYLGRSDGVIQMPGSAPLGLDGTAVDRELLSAVKNAGGERPRLEYFVAGLQPSCGAETSIVLTEIAEPSEDSVRLRLIQGSWPGSIGQAAVTAEAAKLWPIGSRISLISGKLNLEIVAVYENQFDRGARELIVPTGTWSSLSGTTDTDADLLDQLAGRKLYWSGKTNPDQIIDAVKKVAQANPSAFGEKFDPTTSITAETRFKIEAIPPGTNMPLLVSMFAGPLAGGLIGGIFAGLFTTKIRETLWTVGVNHSESRKSALLAVFGFTAIASVLGILLGIAIGVLSRPILDQISDHILGPVSSLPTSFVGLPMALIGVSIGVFVVRLRTGREKVTDREARFDRELYRIVLAIVLVSLAVFLGSGTSDVAQISLAALLIALALVIVIAPWIARLVSKFTPNSFAARLALRRYGRNILPNAITMSLIAFLQILALTLTIFVTSSLANLNSNNESQVPPGQIVFAPQLDDQSKIVDLKADFESNLGLSSPITVYTAGFGTSRQDGATRIVESIEDLEELVRVPLSNEQVKILQDGGSLLSHPLEGDSVTFPADGEFAGVTVPAAQLKGIDPSFLNVDGFMLKSRATKAGIPALIPQYVYTDATSDQAARAEQAAIDLSFSPDWIQVFREPDPWEAPLRIWAISLMLSLIAGAVILLSVVSESRKLRPTLSSLRAIGIGRRFVLKLLLVGVGTTVILGIALAIVTSVIGVAVALALAHMDIPISIPVLPVAIMIVALAVITVFVSWLMTRRLRYLEWLR